MIEITTHSIGINNKYQNIKIKVGDTTINLDALNQGEMWNLCGDLEDFLLDVGHKTEREVVLEEVLSEIHDLACDRSEEPALTETLQKIRVLVEEV